MRILDKLKYTKDHEWVLIEGDIATIGVSDFAQKELGDIVYIEVETQGENLKKEEVFGTVEAVKTVSDLFMPISGTITEINPLLEEDPELVNKDPYGKGWIIKVNMTDLKEEESLLSSNDYNDLLNG